MKLIHVSDLHLGITLADYDLIEDQKYILDEIIRIAKEEAVDGILIAGDVYDKSVPSEKAVSLFDYFLKQLVDIKVKTYIISGNHDSEERLRFGSKLFESNDIFIATKYDGKLCKQQIDGKDCKVNIYMMPYIKASQVKRYYPEAKIEDYDDAIRVIFEHEEINSDEKNILIAHQFVVSGNHIPIYGGSENASVRNVSTVGNIDQIKSESFEVFDYVALGHIHSPQSVGRETIRYSGSPLKYSLSEENNIKSLPIISIGENVTVDYRELKPLRDLRHITGSMDNILKNVENPEDYIYITLTDDQIIDNAMLTVRQYYPRTVALNFKNSHTQEVDDIDLTEIADKKLFSELISEFYASMYGSEITQEEMNIILEVAREAGVSDETY